MQNHKKIVFAARTKNKSLLQESTSGGVFTEISNAVIDRGGAVCGAILSEDMSVRHIVTTEKEVRDGMRGAKYVQSNLTDVIPQVIKLLNNSQDVLFVGTPCQVKAIKNVASLRGVEKHLITIDIVCHGVPSPGLFKEHIDILEQKYGKIDSYMFRDKAKGWHGQNVTVISDSGVVPDVEAKVFSSLYFNSLIIRPSCHKCPFATIEREGDLTIGDYWGITKEESLIDDNLGVSQVMVNSERGLSLFEQVKNTLECTRITTDSYIQPNMRHPTEKSPLSDSFWRTYFRKGIECGPLFLKSIQYRKIPYRIKNIIAKFLGEKA